MRRCVSLLITLLAGSVAAACAAPHPIGETASLAPRVSARPPMRNEPPAPDAAMASPAAEAAIIPLSPPVRLSRKDRTCLVAAMYYEAHGEGEDGMTAVGHVVLNRLRERPAGATVCDVVYERGQFGWTHRVSRKRVAIGSTRGWKSAALLADRLTAGGKEDLTGGATSFYSVLEFTKGPPSWAEAQRETTRIGNHVFVSQR